MSLSSWIRSLFRRKPRKCKTERCTKDTSEFQFPQTTERDYHYLSPYDLRAVLAEGYHVFCENRKLQYLQNHAPYCIKNAKLDRQKASALDRFPLFPLLPLELRNQIWSEAASAPHFLELGCLPEHPCNRWFSHSQAPAMLLASQESRAVVLRNFTILKFLPEGKKTRDDYVQLPPTKLIYFNFSASTLWLCADVKASFARMLLENNVQLKSQLRRLVIDEQVWWTLNNGRDAVTWQHPAFMRKWKRSTAIGGGLQALEEVRFHSQVNEVANSEDLT